LNQPVLTTLLIVGVTTSTVSAQVPAMGQRPAPAALREVVSRSDIACLHEDDYGFIWLCTADGLVRYDGRSQVEIVRQPGLRAFARTYDGRLWTGGPAGLFELWRDAPAGTNPLVRIPGSDGLTVHALLGLPNGALAVATDRGVMQITERTLTPLVVLQLLADGYGYESAGRQMSVTVNTVRTYIRSIYEKLHVNTKSEAVSRALRDGLIR
jgi:DNA-binding CsgD family transcriptional regulator